MTEADVVGPVEIDDPRVRAVVDDATDAERLESRLDETTSGAWVARVDGRPAAAFAWRTWPQAVAHVGVVTAVSFRGRGAGSAVSAHGLRAAREHGLLPQWRVREGNDASIALARRLGLRELGRQYSVDLGAGEGRDGPRP